MIQNLTAIFTIIISINGHHSFSQEKAVSKKDTLTIKGDNIWIREYPKTGKVLFTLNEGATCNVLEKGEKQIIQGLEDFWYKIEHNNKVGWVFGSQSSLRQKASLDNFEPYLKYFIKTCLLENNLDSLLFHKSPVITQFQHKKIGFFRLFNPGAACVNAPINEWHYQNLKYYYNILSEMVPLNYYKDKLPNKGFCEESTDIDGIYYEQHRESLPRYYDFTKDNLMDIPLPCSYQKEEKIKVDILIDHMIWTTLYFIKADDRWWFILKNDCNCDA